MKQPGKLDTVAPPLRKADAVAPTPAPVPAVGQNRSDAIGVAISTGRPSVASPAEVKISVERTAKASAGIFSVQYLLTMLPSWSVSLVSHAALLILLTVIATSPLNDKSASEGKIFTNIENRVRHATTVVARR